MNQVMYFKVGYNQWVFVLAYSLGLVKTYMN